nr:hypothetical protein [Escherichia coli]
EFRVWRREESFPVTGMVEDAMKVISIWNRLSRHHELWMKLMTRFDLMHGKSIRTVIRYYDFPLDTPRPVQMGFLILSQAAVRGIIVR